MNLQAMVDGLSAQWQRERAASQMTLGKLIEALSAIDPDTNIAFADPHSYRGYYSDLAFKRTQFPVRAADLLKVCNGCMGKVFQGYKGGDYVMGELTPLWIAEYGCCGDKLISIATDGSFITASDDES